MKRANAEHWTDLRQQAKEIAVKIAQQKTASLKAKNAETLERIRGKLLERIEREIDRLPEQTGSESGEKNFEYDGEVKIRETTIAWKIRDLTSSYRDLIDEDFRREKLDLDKQKAESESW